MGMFNKLKTKLEEAKNELGLDGSRSDSSHTSLQQYGQYPGQSRWQQQPWSSQGYQYQYPAQTAPVFSGYPGTSHAFPSGSYPPNPPYHSYPSAAPPISPSQLKDEPPPLPSRPPGFDTPPPAVPPRPPQEPENEATPPSTPRPEPLGFRSCSPFPNDPPKEEGEDECLKEFELTEDEIWEGIPQDQIFYSTSGKKDPLGGQITGHERYLHDVPIRRDGSPGPVLGLYYPEWRIYADRSPSKMREDIATHVYYSFAIPLSNGYLWYMDYWAGTQKPCDGTQGSLNGTRRLKWRQPNIKVILSIGGGTGSNNFKVIASNPQKRIRFAKSVRYWLRKYDLNGVDSM